MADQQPRPGTSGPAESSQNLTDRVLARVADARLVTERRATATRPKSRRRRPASPTSSPVDSPSAEDLKEYESLKRVFREMGISYRRYRSQTQEPVVPGLRDAAYAFRAEPSLASLVAVAAYLDELDLLS